VNFQARSEQEMLGSMEEQEYRQAHHRMEVVQVIDHL
jgi:hypothetical protein